MSLAIGKGGSNIKLAIQLTGYDLDVFRELDNPQDDDIYLDEFSDEIDGWIIDILKDQGFSTAKQVLAADRDDLITRTDLEEETIDEVLGVLKKEFEDENPTTETEA